MSVQSLSFPSLTAAYLANSCLVFTSFWGWPQCPWAGWRGCGPSSLGAWKPHCAGALQAGCAALSMMEYMLTNKGSRAPQGATKKPVDWEAKTHRHVFLTVLKVRHSRSRLIHSLVNPSSWLARCAFSPGTHMAGSQSERAHGFPSYEAASPTGEAQPHDVGKLSLP